MSPNSSEIISDPSLNRSSSANMNSHSRNNSLDYNHPADDHSSSSTPTLTPTPSYPGSPIPDGLIPIQLDPASPRPTLPALSKLANHNHSAPSTPVVQGRNQSSPIPTLAPPVPIIPARLSYEATNDPVSSSRRNSTDQDIRHNDCPKREDIAISILTVYFIIQNKTHMTMTNIFTYRRCYHG